MQVAPSRVDIVGSTLCLLWSDGVESYLDASLLRSHSPSAENKGELDIFGNKSGGEEKKDHKNVVIEKFVNVGNYALRLHFSDGHTTGIYSWEYLRKIDSENLSNKQLN